MDQPLISRRKAMLAAAALLLLPGAAPQGPLLVFDPSAFADDRCLAPPGADCSWGEPAQGDGEPRLSASAALLEPQREAARRLPPLLRPDFSGLLDFGPEVVRGRAGKGTTLRIAARAAHPTACMVRSRHRPDRSACARPGPRRAR